MSRQVFSENMIYIRHQRKMSQREMADALGISLNRYGAWEDGICYPKVNMLVKLCDYLQTKDIYGLITTPLKPKPF